MITSSQHAKAKLTATISLLK